MNSFPYTANDRLYGNPLSLDLSSNPGATPPHSAHGNSTLGKLWLDTSVAPPQLRVCAVVQTQPTYVAGDWFSLGSVTGGGSPALTYMPLAGDSTKAGSLVVNTNLTVGGTGYFGGDVTIHGGGAAALSIDNGGINAVNLTLNGGGDAVLSVPGRHNGCRGEHLQRRRRGGAQRAKRRHYGRRRGNQRRAKRDDDRLDHWRD